jgi:hypothetical protein
MSDLEEDDESVNKADDDEIPAWIADIAEHISGCVEYRWNCHTEWCYVLPADNQWGVHMIELAPAPLELSDRDDAAGAFRLGVEQFDLLAAQELFDEVEEIMFRQPLGIGEVVIQGRVEEEEVRVVFYPANPSHHRS